MKELLKDFSTSIFNSYPIEINTILNDIYLDLSIKGFSNSFCLLEQYYYAKRYVYIVTKHTRLYGLTNEDVENQFNLKTMRKNFACNNIDIDVMLDNCKFNPLSTTVRPQIFNLHLCTN